MLSSNTLGHPAIHARRKRRLSPKALGAALGLCMVVAALTTWLATRTHIVDLGNEQQLSDSGLLQNWAEGAVIVMVRHAERCDSAPGPCLDDPTGITVAGSQAAARVGQGLHQLGLANPTCSAARNCALGKPRTSSSARRWPAKTGWKAATASLPAMHWRTNVPGTTWCW